MGWRKWNSCHGKLFFHKFFKFLPNFPILILLNAPSYLPYYTFPSIMFNSKKKVQVIWFFSSLIGIYGLYKFKRNCIKYYRVGIIISGLFEIISNAWIIPYIPIHITKSLLYIIIYIWFYCLGNL